MNTKTPCEAIVNEPPHFLHTYRCRSVATAIVGSASVCRVHARVARRWKQEGRLEEMIDYWWRKGVR